MKQVTLSIDEETWRLADRAAAERSTTVGALVQEYLRGLAEQPGTQSDPAEALFAALDRARGFRAAERLTRAAAHER